MAARHNFGVEGCCVYLAIEWLASYDYSKRIWLFGPERERPRPC